MTSPAVAPVAAHAVAGTAALAFSTIAANAAGSWMARSDSTLRSTVTPGEIEAVDEPAVVEPERPHRRVEALNPERPEGALAPLAVAVGVLVGLLDRLLGDPDGVLAAAVKALRLLEDLLVLGVSRHAALDAGHG